MGAAICGAGWKPAADWQSACRVVAGELFVYDSALQCIPPNLHPVPAGPRRVVNPPQVSNLPHKTAARQLQTGRPGTCCKDLQIL